MSARKTDSTKRLTGNPGKKRLRGDGAYVPNADLKAPSHLSKDARQVWKRLAPIAKKAGLLKTADIDAFGLLCELTVEVRRFRRELNKHGWTISTRALNSNGQDAGERVKVSPTVRLLESAQRELRAYQDRFGLNPKCRSSIPHQEEHDGPDDFERLMEKGARIKAKFRAKMGGNRA